MSELTSTIDSLYSRDSTLFSNLLGVSNELEVIQDQLAGVNGIADLQSLYSSEFQVNLSEFK